MAQLIGADLGKLDTEIAKLALLADGKMIQPQHVAEIVALVAFQFDSRALPQGRVDEQARGAKIELRHR